MTTVKDLSNENLPEWDLSDLYESIDSPLVEKDLRESLEEARAFQERYKGIFLTQEWQGKDLLLAIQTYEKINEKIGRLTSFSGLYYYKNLNDYQSQKFYQKIQEAITEISSFFVFFPLEISKIKEETLEENFKILNELSVYKPWLNQVRSLSPYQLEERVEKILLDKSLTSSQAWVRLYDETLSSMRFPMEEETLTLSSIVDLMSDNDPQKRRNASFALSKGLEEKMPIFTPIFNNLIKDKIIEDKWRGYKTPDEERHLLNQVEDEVVSCLFDTIKKSYPDLSHRYYSLKAKILGVDKIEYWDRNAPIQQEERVITWLEAKEIVLQAYNDFSPQIGGVAKEFFDNAWIDAPLTEGKASGAFAHPTIPSVHPYILVNFQGRLRDVMTLAHELGHGIHQVLSNKQPYLLVNTPLTLAETASVFGEMLTFKSILSSNTSGRLQLLASKIEDMLNTVIRQIAFYDFEKQVYKARETGELSHEEISNLFIRTQQEALGMGVNVDSSVGNFWAYISHFFHSSFYVYAYAFGDCLVNSLYAVFENDPIEFTKNYTDLLSAGGSKHHKDLLKPFKLYAGEPLFWEKGLQVIRSLIEELEGLATKD